MTGREKLIELVTEALCNQSVEEVVVHLLANGVTVQQWIPVTERLPEDKMVVLAYVPDDEYALVQFDKKYSEWIVCFTSENISYRSEYVTHWMPLPEPPKIMKEE